MGIYLWPVESPHKVSVRQRTFAYHNVIMNFECSDTYFITKNQSDTKLDLTHWGRVTHICLSKLTNIDSDNGLSPDRPSHYRNQCWRIVDWSLGNNLQWNLNQNIQSFIQENAFENAVWKMAANLCRPQFVKDGSEPWPRNIFENKKYHKQEMMNLVILIMPLFAI